MLMSGSKLLKSVEDPQKQLATPGASKYPILDNLTVPGPILETWQATADLIADLIQVPAALIMRVHPWEIEVFVTSHSVGNVYEAGERAKLDTGLYCETVMDTQKLLCVPNALEDHHWERNPDIELGMISYYGLPLIWPSGEIFGTFCVLDNKTNAYTQTYRRLIARFRDSIQLSIDLIYQNHMNSLETERTKEEMRILSQAVDQSPTSIMITDTKGVIEYVNRAFEKISGYRAKEVLGENPRLLKSGKTPLSVYKDLWKSITSLSTWEGELENRRKNGELYWEHIRIGPVLDTQNNICHFMAMREDITHQKEQTEIIQHLAFYDPLTDLPNRALVLDRLNQLLIDAKRNGKRLAVLFLDLDDFKKINDSLGHIEGDNMLVEASQRLRDVVRETDTVGRLGGDEFVVLLGNIDCAEDVHPVAENLLACFHHKFHLKERAFLVTASLGVAIYPEDGQSSTELLRNADTAMYCAKDLGRNTYCYFTNEMNQDVFRRLLIEEQLNGALGRGEFHVCYQPLTDTRTRTTISAEALLRWKNSVLGEVAPEEFIPIAERTRLIVQIGRFVLSEALQWAAEWKKLLNRDFRIAVNLSPHQLRDEKLVPYIEEKLEQYRVSGNLLELEITEGVLLQGHPYVEKTLASLKALGIGIALDDFGTGYSSLNYLRKYSFNKLKIDRTFIKDIIEDSTDRILVDTSIAMAHGLGLEVVAEGVETEEQLQHLSDLQCDTVQGYLLSRPIVPEELTRLISNEHARSVAI
jgi:diguanylate cyclase (GGDEF)-like protein/PAS domain S-box-containing protein